MKKNWNEDELLTDFVLMPNELHLSMVNKTEANRLGFALLLKYFQQEAKFPSTKQDVPKVIIEYIAKQLDISPERFEEYRWGGKEKTYTRHRKNIRDFFGFQELTRIDNERFEQWLEGQVPFTHNTDYLTNQAYSLFRKWKVEPPSIGSLKRMIDSAIDTFEKNLYQETYQQLSSKTCTRLDDLLESHDNIVSDGEESDILAFRQLLSFPRKPSVNTMEMEVKKLLAIRHLLKATVDHPNGIIQDTLYPIVSSSTIRDIIKDMSRNSREYKEKIYIKMHSSYRGHYRSALCDILKNLTFKSNNLSHQPIIEALQLIQEYSDSGQRFFAIGDEVPIEGVIQPKWRDIIIETDSKGIERVNRINYEIAVLQSLRIRLRCKEIWIEGADRYRNPDEDLPQDFEEHKEEYFQALKVPIDVEPFISDIIQLMKDKLHLLNQGFENKSNGKIAITSRNNKGWIRVTPLDKQPEPPHLPKIKQEIRNRWSNINLLDLLKETDFHTSFTKHFKTIADRSILDGETIQRRLLLSLFGLGTNTGLKAVSAGNTLDSYRELQYIRNKFIHKDHLRQANAEVTNRIIYHRRKEIWGGSYYSLCFRLETLWFLGSKPSY